MPATSRPLDDWGGNGSDSKEMDGRGTHSAGVATLVFEAYLSAGGPSLIACRWAEGLWMRVFPSGPSLFSSTYIF